MKRFYTLFFITLFAASAMFAAKDNETQRKSGDPGITVPTNPEPFRIIGNPHNSPAISTGYYFVDSEDIAPSFWKPSERLASLDEDVARWRRIIAGPRINGEQYWQQNTDEGLRFFRNPALPVQNGGDFFEHNPNYGTDSTDDAIAGPIPMKLIGGFYFNGVRYDSFYVSTNGLISLTNRRYFYDENGNKTIPPGETSAYDPNSMDWFQSFVDGEDRRRSGNGLTDNTTDDFGYEYAVLQGRPNDPNSGLLFNPGNATTFLSRSRGNSPFQTRYKGALISFLWGDNHLSQFSETLNQVDDHGQVHYKRNLSNDKLIIYFINLAGKGNKTTRYGTRRVDPDLRPGDENYISASGQVVLNRKDSSITVLYERFVGNIDFGFGRTVPAQEVFRYNGVIGVRGFARHANYNRNGGPGPNDDEFPWVQEYEQYTHYMAYDRNPFVSYPDNFQRIKFKQYQNTLRVADISYRVRKQKPNTDLDFTEVVPTREVNDYELYAGNERLGAMQPVAIIQNLSNDIQGPLGINYVEQDLNFQARFRIVNLATDRIIYNRLVPVDNTCLSLPDDRLFECTGDPNVRVRLVDVEIDDQNNYQATPKTYPGTNSWNGNTRNGIPTYEFAEVKFPPFEPNEFATDENGKLYQIGRMRAFVIADPTNPVTGQKLGDTWPFDDTASVRLHVIRNHDSFVDDATEFHLIEGVPMPSVQKWVNIDAEVVNGNVQSRHPLPPRGRFYADNNEDFFRDSPAILMNRKQLNGLDHNPLPGGDELRSHPIDMRGKRGSVISLSVQRTKDKEFWDRGFGDNILTGPEPRGVVNGDIFAVWGNTIGTGRAASARPDYLALEIMLPSDNGVENITNVADSRWRNHPRRGGADAETNVPALAVYGAGGYLTGFLENDRDSALALPNPGTRELNSLRADIYDDGYDFEYNKYFVSIPDTFINWQNNGAQDFRFRLKVFATNDQKCIICIPDDDDDFIVDNVRILFQSSEATDIEVSSTKILWPYTQAPATQATSIPVRAKVSNNTNNPAPAYYVLVKIYKQGQEDPIYCRYKIVTSHPGNEEFEVELPDFNARPSGPGRYYQEAIVVVPGGDLEERNDTTYTEYDIEFGDSFAYDPVENPSNDVASLSNGRGLNIDAFADGGRGNINGPAGTYNELVSGAGYIGGSSSGQIAMKFELLQADTIFGYQAYFGTKNQAPDAIAFALYRGNRNSNLPVSLISESVIERERGRDDIRDDLYFGEYVDYRFPDGEEVILQAGIYWMAISQLGETGLELGATGVRGGMRTMSIFIPPPVNFTSNVGGSGISLNIHKEFRTVSPADNLINNNFFAFENTRNSNEWVQFTPSQGNVAYAHLHHFGNTIPDPTTLTMTNGFWVPLIRPYTGEKSSGSGAEPIEDCGVPIELVNFEGDQRKGAVDLFWTTASEENNRGFYIERSYKVNGEFTDYSQIAFVDGNGTTQNQSNYAFSDKDVTNGNVYRYRLRQVDLDGTQSCFDSQIVEVEFKGGDNFALANYPNPVNANAEGTTIEYTLPTDTFVTIEVLDMYGNVVRTLVSENATQGYNTVQFNGLTDYGQQLPAGAYTYRITADGKSETSRMTIVK